jgi:hypothetical protein
MLTFDERQQQIDALIEELNIGAPVHWTNIGQALTVPRRWIRIKRKACAAQSRTRLVNHGFGHTSFLDRGRTE